MAARISSHGRRMIHSSAEAKGRTIAVPSCVSHAGVLPGTLRSSTTQRPPPERAAAPWAMTPAVRLYPILGTREHRIGQVDADDPATGTDRLLKQREVQTCAACDVGHG